MKRYRKVWIKTLLTSAMILPALASGQGGPGMMQGYGPGYGMGPGMMQGYGPGYGMGPGMMQGYGSGYGMGPGMMQGYGSGYGMGPGMMYGYGAWSDLKLSPEQRSKIAAIQNDIRRKHWELMGKMHEEQAQLEEQFSSDKQDDVTLSKRHRAISDLRQQMFEQALAARKQIDGILTKEQRDKLRTSGPGMWRN
jgi:Spy/CpxP family protein refolding chaperone